MKENQHLATDDNEVDWFIKSAPLSLSEFVFIHSVC